MSFVPPFHAFLADFGLARTVSTGSKLTRTGVALGTPAYMSPEQARGETASLTPATDVWGLGCVLHEMLAGRPPWEAETTAALVARILLEPAPPVRKARPDVPPGLERVLDACLEKDARRRYAGAGDLRDDLARLLAGEAPLARPQRRVSVAGVAFVLIAGPVAVAALLGGCPGDYAPALPGATTPRPPGEDLAARARGLRSLDPREAARLLGEALEAEPGRHAWRLERGLLLWAIGDGEGARAAWKSVPSEAPEGPPARLGAALEAIFDFEASHADRLRRVAEALQNLQARSGREARIARAAVESIRGEWDAAREALGGESGWDASLVRAYVESWDPRGDRDDAIREFGLVLEGGIPVAGVHAHRAALRGERGDVRGALEDCDAALRIQPRLGAALSIRAKARWLLGDARGALRDAEEAVALMPGDSTTFLSQDQLTYMYDGVQNRTSATRHIAGPPQTVVTETYFQGPGDTEVNQYTQVQTTTQTVPNPDLLTCR